ncbi:unnamed protein product [Polarella glacialis]|uniref:Gamma-soluble NSF attachment protein n=1 Tax=Polarella glacialis TaxID=89957 RepID=A0A813FKZ1_POLGL|nr:unnamed protein product [Polarella glacialis]CAE8640172.1 unnamed protein product [Polarella glacialis]
MGPAEDAKVHLAQAEKALKASWMSLKFSPDHLSASMEYSHAATQFRAAGLLAESADAWTKAGAMKEELHDLFGAGRAYESAGAICDGTGPGGPTVAAGHWDKAIRCFRLCGKSEIAAKLILKLASLREKQGDMEGTKTAFQDAIEVFQQDEKDYELGDVYKSYIAFLLRSGALEEALKAMDGHVEVLVRQKHLPFAHKELLSKVVLMLHLQDTVRANEALNTSGDVAGWFPSKECQVGSELVAAFQAHDPEAVASLIKDQIFSFLQVEVARIAKQLRVIGVRTASGGAALEERAEEAHLADMLM